MSGDRRRSPHLSGEADRVLDHESGKCTGNWRLVGQQDARRITCELCDRSYAPTPENRLAAIDENYAGIYLRRLAAEGAHQKDE